MYLKENGNIFLFWLIAKKLETTVISVVKFLITCLVTEILMVFKKFMTSQRGKILFFKEAISKHV